MPDELGRGFATKGDGMVTLTKYGLSYDGIIDNVNVHKFFEIKSILYVN